MAEGLNNTIVQLVHQKPFEDRLDAMDILMARHSQALAVLASLSSSFKNAESVPGVETVRNTIWAVEELLHQAQNAAAQLS